MNMKPLFPALATCLVATSAFGQDDPRDRLQAALDEWKTSGDVLDYSIGPGALNDKGQMAMAADFSITAKTGSLKSGGLALENTRKSGFEFFGLFGVIESDWGVFEYGNIYALMSTNEVFNPLSGLRPACTGQERDIAFITGDVDFTGSAGTDVSALVFGVHFSEEVTDTSCILTSSFDVKGMTLRDAEGQIILEDAYFTGSVSVDPSSSKGPIVTFSPELPQEDPGAPDLTSFLHAVFYPMGASELIPSTWSALK
jgi:hypothetical protein